jgi:hypothetical protein
MYSFVVDRVVVVLVGTGSAALDQTLLLRAVVLQTCPEQLGLGRVEVAEWGEAYAT